MTLPFRRRHHDDESAHDRARSLASRQMLEPIGDDEAAWLTAHLEGCGECRQDRIAYLADRDLLRSLRERTPEPPRDLWARTSAAIERESRARQRRVTPARRRGFPFAPAAGALIVVVAFVASIMPPRVPPPDSTPGTTPGGVTAGPEATPFDVEAGKVGWIRPAANGSWELVVTGLDAVCPRNRPECRPLVEEDPPQPVNLGGLPTNVTLSPNEEQLVFQAPGQGTAPDKIYVMALPVASPTVTDAPTVPPATDTPPSGPPSSDTPPTDAPPSQPAGSQEPTPAPTGTPVEIASGVVVVGEAAYSPDGAWLAFSARPSDGSAGPDLYVWTAGLSTAMPVTTDHRTYFSAWYGSRILASHVELEATPTETLDPSADPSAEPTAEPTEAPTTEPTPATTDANGSPVPPIAEVHARSFLFDPATQVRTEIEQPDVWLPVVDPTGRSVAYWSGTLVPSADGLDWALGTGQLVLDAWSTGVDPEPSLDPSASPATSTASPTAPATEAPATATPATSGEPEPTAPPALGPAGNPQPIDTGAIATFTAKFDPDGLRLGLWVGEQLDASVGRLQLIVLDPATGQIDVDTTPLPNEPALRRFSIDLGRVAWVSPSGQDGKESAVKVLGWNETEAGEVFGEIRTIPAQGLSIVR